MALFCLAGLAACGDDGGAELPTGTPRCDAREARSVCVEYTGSAFTTDARLVFATEEACTMDGAFTHEATNSICSTAAAVGRCERGAGTAESSFTYNYSSGGMPFTRMTAMAACADGAFTAF